MKTEKKVKFTWDDKKKNSNAKKHRVTFEEAQSVFLDENARLILDPDHSENEERFILLGMSEKRRLLTVCHCYREDDSVIRLISARTASRHERVAYEEYVK